MAICKAFRKFFLPEAANAASKAVVVVPRFDPSVKGYTLSTLIRPTPTCN